MLFDMTQPKDLLTPPIHYGGVNKINPILTSSDIFLLDDNDVCFSAISSAKANYELVTTDNTNENIDNHQEQQDDLFSTFDLPVLTELEKIDLQNDDFHKYLTQTSFSTPSTDIHNTSMSEDSTYISMDDSTSAAFPWVAEECTVESQKAEDMMVPSSPTLSLTSSNSSVSQSKTKKKSSLSTIERKLRKKDQNKTAAEKYRLKKRSERDELASRHSELKDQNRELKFELDNLSFQLEQFKQLFVDVLQIPIPSNKQN